jgi:hypothetical protein
LGKEQTSLISRGDDFLPIQQSVGTLFDADHLFIPLRRAGA